MTSTVSDGRERTLTRWDGRVLVVLTVAAALLRFVYLSRPHVLVFDEVHFANFAHDYLTNTKFFDAEPPLAKFIIAAGEALFGFTSFGWRVMPALFGTAVVPLIYLLAKKVFGRTLTASFAGALALSDGLLLVESRTAVIDIFVVFFILTTYLAFFYSLQAKSRLRSLLWLGATGVSLGLGLSVKWVALATTAPIVAIVLVLTLSKDGSFRKSFRIESRRALCEAFGARQQNIQGLLSYAIFLFLVPSVLYSLIFSFHVPFDITGEPFFGIHRQIFDYHRNLKATHPYASMWYTWPFLVRPVSYYFDSVSGFAGIVAIGNPVVWWAGAGAVAATIWRASARLFGLALVLGVIAAGSSDSARQVAAFCVLPILALAVLWLFRQGEVLLAFALLGLLAHYGPWSLIPRILFLYEFAGALPFVILILADVMRRAWDRQPIHRDVQAFVWVILGATVALFCGLIASGAQPSGPLSVSFFCGAAASLIGLAWFGVTNVSGLTAARKQVLIFLVVAGLAFLYFYPIWTGVRLSPAAYEQRMWFRSWI